MTNHLRAALASLLLSSFLPPPSLTAAPVVDCTCVANLPGLQTNACQGIVPDLCLLAANCFSTNVVIGSPGYCSQSPAAGTIVGLGPTSILLTVMDSQSNSTQCAVTFSVVDTNPPVALCSTFNLVINGQFEGYTNCPTGSAQLGFAAPWFNPTAATPDYYNSCAPAATGVSTPGNVLGNQAPFSGQGYAGAFVYTTSATNSAGSYREYLEGRLVAPLIAGTSYSVSFRVSLAENCSEAIAEIGARLCVGTILSNGMTGVLNLVPQVVNPSTNVLTSTNSWMLVEGVFTAAGGEDHVILGNFLADPATTAVPAAGTLFTGYSYYYFDEVSVVALCGPEATNKTVLCGSAWTFDPPVGYDECSGNNVTVSVLSTTTNSLCPFVATRTWLLTDLSGNTNSWSQTLTSQDTNPPVALCAAGANLVPNGNFENYAYCPYFFSQVTAAVTCEKK